MNRTRRNWTDKEDALLRNSVQQGKWYHSHVYHVSISQREGPDVATSPLIFSRIQSYSGPSVKSADIGMAAF